MKKQLKSKFINNVIYIHIKNIYVLNYKIYEGTLAEWTKALGISPNSPRNVGSTPTGTMFLKKKNILLYTLAISLFKINYIKQ